MGHLPYFFRMPLGTETWDAVLFYQRIAPKQDKGFCLTRLSIAFCGRRQMSLKVYKLELLYPLLVTKLVKLEGL